MEALVGSVIAVYADKYIENLRPGDLRLSLWGTSRSGRRPPPHHHHAPPTNSGALTTSGYGGGPLAALAPGGDLVLRNLTLKLHGAPGLRFTRWLARDRHSPT